MRQLVRIAAVLLVTLLALVGILRWLEYAVLYHPHPYRANYRNLVSHGVIELPFRTSAGEQMAFYLPPHDMPGVPARIWVVFCGNGSLALDWLPVVEHGTTNGNGFLLIDYPGYGKSEGRPNVENTRAAADGALLALAAKLGVDAKTLESKLNAIGHSLGAAAALDFASHHRQVRRVILFAPFTSVREEAATIVGTPVSHLLAVSYDNRASLRELANRLPPPQVTIFHGLADSLIPPAMGQELAAEFPGFVTFRGIRGANHDTVVSEAEDEMLALVANASQ